VETAKAALKLVQIGNSVRVILPKDVLAKLEVEKGDTLSWTEASDGITLTPYGRRSRRRQEVAREVMKRRRPVLRELAK